MFFLGGGGGESAVWEHWVGGPGLGLDDGRWGAVRRSWVGLG